MDGKSLMQKAISNCDLYFEGELISKERLIQVYAQFITDTFDEKDHNIAIILHTGSICFDIVSIMATAVSNLILNETAVHDILDALELNDIVLYGKERHIYKGIEEKDFGGELKRYVILEQVRTDKTGTYQDKNYVPMGMTYKIQPYNGESKRMDGRGIRKDIKKRNEFISTVFDIKENEIPSLTNTSSVIVMPRELADRIINNLEIHYDDDKSIKLLDIVTASYFTECDEYQYGGNPGKTEATLKITSKVSVARELIFKPLENKITGFTTIGYNSISGSNTELPELINRRSLRYVYLSYHIDSEYGETFINDYEDADVFACTKDFLLSNSLPCNHPNLYTSELNTQVENIINKEIHPIIIDSLRTWDEYKKIKKALYFIRKSEITGDAKDSFIIQACALLNLFTTAVFTMNTMENLIASHELDTSVLSPQKRIDELKYISDTFPDTLKEQAKIIIDNLELMYFELKDECKKADKLVECLYENEEKVIAVIVPKAYYEVILHKMFLNKFSESNIKITTANKFDNSILYDEIIIVGDFKGKRFNTFKSKASSDISVLLYEFESKLFNYKMKQSIHTENLFNSKSRIKVEINEQVKPLYDVENDGIDEINGVSDDLDLYLIKLNELSARNIIQRAINEYSNVVDVAMIGTFADGENIFFTKAYKAYVFDEHSEEVKEVGIDELSSGDILIFTKRIIAIRFHKACCNSKKLASRRFAYCWAGR